MATFIPGLTDTVPDIQPFAPDMGMLNRTLAIKQSRYDQGFSQIRNTYNSVMSSPVSNAGAREARDRYLDNADKQLKGLSSMDLSHPDNVTSAQRVFDPISNDNDLMYDMTATKNILNERQKVAAARDSPDEKVRDTYWSVGEEYLNLTVEELSRATYGDGSIQKVKQRKYVPYEDPIKALNKEFVAAGLGTVVESPSGTGYIMVDKNGKQMAMPARVFAESNLNAKHREIIRVQSEVAYNRDLKGQISSGHSEEEAKQVLGTRMFDRNRVASEKNVKGLDEAKSTIDEQIKSQRDLITANFKGNVPPGSEEGKRLLQLMQQQKALEGNLADAKEKHERFTTKGQETLSSYSRFGSEYYADSIKDDYINKWVYYQTEGKREVTYKKDEAFWENTQHLDRQAALNQQLQIAQMNNATSLQVASMRGTAQGVDTDGDGTIDSYTSGGSGGGGGKGVSLSQANAGQSTGPNPMGVKDLGNNYQQFIRTKKELGDQVTNLSIDFAENALVKDHPQIGSVMNEIREKITLGKTNDAINPKDPKYADIVKGIQGPITFKSLYNTILKKANHKLQNSPELGESKLGLQLSITKAGINSLNTVLDEMHSDEQNFSSKVFERDPQFNAIREVSYMNGNGKPVYSIRTYDALKKQYEDASQIVGYKNINVPTGGMMGMMGMANAAQRIPVYKNDTLARNLAPYVNDKDAYDELVAKANNSLGKEFPNTKFAKNDLAQYTNIYYAGVANTTADKSEQIITYLMGDNMLRELKGDMDSNPERAAVDYRKYGDDKEVVSRLIHEMRNTMLTKEHRSGVTVSLHNGSPNDDRKSYRIEPDAGIIDDMMKKYKDKDDELGVLQKFAVDGITFKTNDTGVPGAPSEYSVLSRVLDKQGFFKSDKSLSRFGDYTISKLSNGQYKINGNLNVFNPQTRSFEKRAIGDGDGLTVGGDNAFESVIDQANRMLSSYGTKSLDIKKESDKQAGQSTGAMPIDQFLKLNGF